MATTLQPMLEAPLLQEMTTELDTIPGVVIRQVHTVSLVCLLKKPVRQCACSLLGHMLQFDKQRARLKPTVSLKPPQLHGGAHMQLVLAAAHVCGRR